MTYKLKSSETSNLLTVKTTSKKTYSYDENGNNTKEVDSTQNITKVMTYDVDNRLDTYTKTENNETITQNNLYNGNGQRIQKTEGDNTINYYYQNENVLYTTDSDENKTSHNFVGLEGNIIHCLCLYLMLQQEFQLVKEKVLQHIYQVVLVEKNLYITLK